MKKAIPPLGMSFLEEQPRRLLTIYFSIILVIIKDLSSSMQGLSPESGSSLGSVPKGLYPLLWVSGKNVVCTRAD